MINVVCGRQGTGKTEFIMQQIKRIPNDRSVFLVVPEQFTYENERMLFESLQTNGLMHVQVLSFQRLAYRIAEASPLQQQNIITQEGKALIMKRVIDEVLPSLHVFRGVGNKIGFMDEAMSLIDEFKRNMIAVDEISDVQKKESAQSLRDKLQDIKTIYQAYHELLPDEYADQNDYLSSCAEYADRYRPLCESEIFIDGFYSLDRSSAPLLTAMMRLSANLTFALTYDESDSMNFTVSQDTLQMLKACATQVGKEISVTTLSESYHQQEELGFLEHHLLSHQQVVYQKQCDAITLLQANNIEEEAELAASTVIRLIRTHAMRYRDIAIVVSDLETYAPILEDVLYAHHIPYFIDQRKPIIFSSPIKAFLFLVSMLKDSVSGADVIAFAKTGFSDLDEEEIMLIENYALECGIKGSMWERPFVRNNREESYNLGEIETIRQRLLEPIDAYRTLMHGCCQAKDFCEKTYRFFTDWGLKQRIEQYVATFQKEEDYETANTYAQIYNKIILVLEQLYDLFEHDEIDARGFHQMLRYGFIHADVGIIPSMIDKINIGDIVRTRVGNIKALIVLGANEGTFPSANIANGILSEHEKLSLKNNGLDLIPRESYQRKKEQFLIYTLLSKPSEKLVLGRSLLDGQGEEQREAYLFERIRTMFPKIEIIEGSDYSQNRLHLRITDVVSALQELSRYLSHRKTNPEATEEDRYFEAVYWVMKEIMPEKLAVIEEGLDFTNEAFIEDIDQYREALRMPLVTSISKLETYASCPFKFFSEYLIRPQQRREHQLHHYDIGTILHQVIERYSNLILEHEVDARTISQEQILSVIDRIASEEIDRFAAGFFAQIVRGTYFKTKLTRAAQHAAAEITRQLKRSDFLLTETEAKFYFQEQYQPICVEIEDVGKVYVQGKIDRIDTYEHGDSTYVRIIDYKTGSKEFDLTKAYYGLSLQLPVYMKVFTDSSDVSRAAGVFYFRIKSPMIPINQETDDVSLSAMIQKEFALKGITLKDMTIIKAMDHDAEEQSFLSNVSVKKDGSLRDHDSLIEPEIFAALLEHTTDKIAQFSKEIVNAEITARPYRYGPNEKPCNWCDLQSFCKFSESFAGNCYQSVRKMPTQDIHQRLTKRNEQE